jgi:hypothetical protein
MPLEVNTNKPIEADWTFIEIDCKQRGIQFKESSLGDLEKWHWDFGDGNVSEDKTLHIVMIKPVNG